MALVSCGDGHKREFQLNAEKERTRDMSTLKNSMLELAAKFDDNYNTGLIKSFMFGLNKTEIKTMTDILSRYKFRDSHAAPAREDCLALAACHNRPAGLYAVRSGTSSFFPFSSRPEENLKHTKKTEQTRTIRQIHRDLTYHNSAELDSFSIM
ncbi:hypothetical protein TNCV_1195101 [Trichonephila clavipes]|nr:hypothetical protein TNCV_1195101 [Trichonephila clavipes]